MIFSMASDSHRRVINKIVIEYSLLCGVAIPKTIAISIIKTTI